VLAFSLLASFVTGTLFGWFRRSSGSRANPNDSLREGERGSSLGKSRPDPPHRGRDRIVLRPARRRGFDDERLRRLTRVDPGFNAERLLCFHAGLATSAEATRQTSFYRR